MLPVIEVPGVQVYIGSCSACRELARNLTLAEVELDAQSSRSTLSLLMFHPIEVAVEKAVVNRGRRFFRRGGRRCVLCLTCQGTLAAELRPWEVVGDGLIVEKEPHYFNDPLADTILEDEL